MVARICRALAVADEMGKRPGDERHTAAPLEPAAFRELVGLARGKKARYLALALAEDTDPEGRGGKEALEARRRLRDADKHERRIERDGGEGVGGEAAGAGFGIAGRHHRDAGGETAERVAQRAGIDEGLRPQELCRAAGTEPGGRRGRGGWIGREVNGIGRDPPGPRAGIGVGDRGDHAARRDMGVGRDVGDRVHRAEGHAPAEKGGKGALAVPRRPCRDAGVDLGRIRPPRGAGGKARIGAEVGRPHRARKLAPEGVIDDPERDLAIARREDAERGKQRVAVALGPRHGAVEVVLIDCPLAQAQHRVIHRHVEKLPPPRGLGCTQGGDDPEGEERAGKDVAHAGADLDRRRGIGAGQGDDPAHRLRDHIIGGPVGIGALAGSRIAEPPDSGIDEPRVGRGKAFVTETEALHHAGAEVLDHDIGIGGKSAEIGLARLGLEVEHDALLRAVEADEIPRPLVLRIIRPERPVRARGVTPGVLDLDDLGAMVGEHHRGIGARQHPAEVEHPHPGQNPARVRHGLPAPAKVRERNRTTGAFTHSGASTSAMWRNPLRMTTSLPSISAAMAWLVAGSWPKSSSAVSTSAGRRNGGSGATISVVPMARTR